MRLWPILLLTACAGAAPDEAALHTAGDEVPASDRDPLPFTPSPAGEGRTGETVALVAAGGEDQARQLLPALLRAVRDADERALEGLFADEVARTNSRADTPPRPRAVVVERILIYAQQQVVQPDVPLDELVDFSAVEVTRAAQFWEGRELPEGISPTDVVVEIPLLDAGRGPLRGMLEWHLRGRMVVRPGRDPRIVAL